MYHAGATVWERVREVREKRDDVPSQPRTVRLTVWEDLGGSQSVEVVPFVFKIQISDFFFSVRRSLVVFCLPLFQTKLW